jgi:hypothetical protein
MLLLVAAALLAAVGLLIAPQWCQAADSRRPSAEAAEPATESSQLPAEVAKSTAESQAPIAATVKPPSVTSWGTVLPIERAIEEALDSPTEVELLETPLPDAIAWLEDLHRIEIEIDGRALEDAGLTPTDLLITKSLQGMSLRSALHHMLRKHNLAYVIHHEALLITTPEEAETLLRTRIYPVGDLLVPKRRSAQFSGDGEALIKAITSTVAPTTWEGVGGAGSIEGASFGDVEMLLITQTRAVHRQIDAFLKLLRNTVAAERTPAADRASGN